MSYQINNQSYPQQLENFRKRIDEIDEKLIELLIERMKIVAEVGALKKANNEKFFIKSAREANMLRKLVQNSQNPQLTKSTIISIWRKIITNANMLEQSFSIALHNPKNISDFEYLVHDFYNNEVPIMSFESAHNVVFELEKGNCQIAVFELPEVESEEQEKDSKENWWINLANNKIGLRVFAKFPFFKSKKSDLRWKFSLVAAAIKPAEKSQLDCSLLVVELPQEISLSQLLLAFKEQNFSARILKRAINQFEKINFFLVEVNEFIEEEDLRLKKLETSKIKAFIRIIGHFPQPIQDCNESDPRF